MKRAIALLIGAVGVVVLSDLPSAAPPMGAPALTTLAPGGFRTITQTLPVNIVFVGYEPGAGPRDINEAAFRAGLPATYASVNRFPAFYGLPAGTGVQFTFAYNLVYANAAFEDSFFGYLGSIAAPRPRTLYQNLYNGQAARSLNVTNNAWIDAPSVETWLGNNASAIGVDASQYTIFFINWYGRADFRFHVYTKTDEPDPDTGFNFGEVTSSRKLIAWGGTAPDDEESGSGVLRRIWFYDLSAGPEAWTDNWNLANADLDGNGRMDYRMPPVWEYGNLGAYRPFNNLSGDLARVARYVGIDLLFTTSPLYKPAISAPKLPDDIQVDINVYDAQPLFTGASQHKLPLIVSELNELQPYNTYSAQLGSARFDNRAAKIYDCFLFGPSCYGSRLFGISFGDLFLNHQDQLLQHIDGDADYEVPVFAYNLADSRAGGLLGFADDNWADGTQSFVFTFVWPAINGVYGLTTTTIHEVGHHVGMSHPHDGYDAETGVDFGPGDAFYFAWSGDESNSVMSYIDLNWDFSQFDRDNMNRHMVVTYINQANRVLAAISASPRAGQAGAILTSADADAAAALAAYAAMNYAGAATRAKSAYAKVLQAAGSINVMVEPQAWAADYKAKGSSPKFVDTVNYQRMKP
jgi:hypothetical protein